VKSDETNGSHRLVQLRFKPLWLYIDAVREFCGFFARATFEDAELGQRVGLVVHELVENAVRYGDDQELELRVERSIAGIAVHVANTTSEARVARLKKVFDELMSLRPADAYKRALRNAALLPPSESGLGLPRIRYEGQVDLELDASPGRVAITARGAI